MDHQLFIVYTYGSVEVYFEALRSKPSFQSEAKRLELLDRLNALPGVAIPGEKITQRPSIRLAVLSVPDVLERFLAIYDWVVSEIKAHSPQP